MPGCTATDSVTNTAADSVMNRATDSVINKVTDSAVWILSDSDIMLDECLAVHQVKCQMVLLQVIPNHLLTDSVE